MNDYKEPYSWWGGSARATPRSIVQLMDGGVLDAQLGGVLWAALSRRASVLVAAASKGAGATTVLTALLDLLPSDTDRIFLRGWEETFDFAQRFRPERSYALVNKL